MKVNSVSPLRVEIWLITLKVNFDYVGLLTLTFLVKYLDWNLYLVSKLNWVHTHQFLICFCSWLLKSYWLESHYWWKSVRHISWYGRKMKDWKLIMNYGYKSISKGFEVLYFKNLFACSLKQQNKYKSNRISLWMMTLLDWALKILK